MCHFAAGLTSLTAPSFVALPRWNIWPHRFRFGAAGIVGTFAAVLTTVALIPQLIRVWERKSAEDVSLGMFLFFSAGVLLWFIYGLLIHSFPVEAANGISFLFSLAILILKLRYDREEDRGGE